MPSFFLMIRRHPRSTLFPSPMLFRFIRVCETVTFRVTNTGAIPHDFTLGDEATDRKSTRLNSSHGYISYAVFFFNDTATPEIYPLPLPDALPIYQGLGDGDLQGHQYRGNPARLHTRRRGDRSEEHTSELQSRLHLVCRLFF